MATTVDVSVSQGSAYTWRNAGFAWSDPDGGKTWDTAIPMVYALSVGEGWGIDDGWRQRYDLKPQENWRTGEEWAQTFTSWIGEVCRMNECWTDIWRPWLRVFESWVLTETPLKSIFMPTTERWAMSEETRRMPRISKFEGLATDDTWHPQYVLHLSEGWVTAELVARLVRSINKEAFHTTDSQPEWEVVKAIAEACCTAETYHEMIWFNYRAVENITFEATPLNHAVKFFAESFQTTESWAQYTIKKWLESFVAADSMENRAQFRRLFKDTVRVTEAIAKACDITLAEAFSIVEAYLRNANAVLSDISFGKGDLSLADFLKLNSPVGYSSFTAFVPGELEYRKALISLVINGPLTTGRPKITDWRLTVDVPDQTDSGTCAIPAANTFILFSRRFFASPEVFVQLRGGSSGTPNITKINDMGFYVEIDDSVGQTIAGDIVWSAVGY